MSFCLRSSSDGPVSTVVIGSLISDTISARTGTRLEEWDFILHRGSMMYLTRLWLTWSMISMSWRRLSTALLKVQSAIDSHMKSQGKSHWITKQCLQVHVNISKFLYFSLSFYWVKKTFFIIFIEWMTVKWKQL